MAYAGMEIEYEGKILVVKEDPYHDSEITHFGVVGVLCAHARNKEDHDDVYILTWKNNVITDDGEDECNWDDYTIRRC